MRRYKFLDKDYIFSALNRLRSAFLAAKDGQQVEEIIKGILTSDERLKIGRRIEIAQMLKEGFSYLEISQELKAGRSTISLVERKLNQNPLCFQLINQREQKVEKEFKQKAYRKIGDPMKVFKTKEYTGFTRKFVKR